MDKFSIRRYQPVDFQEVIGVFNTNVPDFFDPSETQDLFHYLEQEIEDYFVIIKDAQIVGAGGINYDADGITARLSWDFLDRNMQQNGAGTILTQHRILHVQQLPHIQRLIVRTSQMAEGFYQKMGFVVKERLPDYWAKGFDLVVMEFKA